MFDVLGKNGNDTFIKNLIKSVFKTIAHVFILVAVTAPAIAQEFNLNQIPNGFIEARRDTPPGVFGSNFGSVATLYQDQLTFISNKVYGFSIITSTTPELQQAETTYYLEHLVIGMIQEIINSDKPLSPFERMSLVSKAISIYSDIRFYSERLFEHMIRVIDTALPGASGIQIPTEGKAGELSYTPNYRVEKILSQEEQFTAYEKRKQEFLGEGGSLNEIKALNSALIDSFKPLTVVEYVTFPNNTVQVTEGSAGHILLSGGRDVISAGQIIFLKDKNNRLQFAIITNASGSFKPDLYSTQQFAESFAHTYNLNPDFLIVTKGEPLSAQTVKVLMKAAGQKKDVIKQKVADMKTEANAILTNPMAYLPANLTANSGGQNAIALAIKVSSDGPPTSNTCAQIVLAK